MYIRTKNNIYEVENILRDNRFVKGYNVGEMAFITKDQVIKQAETIEELCDEFRYSNHERCWGSGKTWYDYDIDFVLNEKEMSTIKGAIWTDRGLIYVAKMNDKGDLELI